jgi:hypothetical protein
VVDPGGTVGFSPEVEMQHLSGSQVGQQPFRRDTGHAGAARFLDLGKTRDQFGAGGIAPADPAGFDIAIEGDELGRKPARLDTVVHGAGQAYQLRVGVETDARSPSIASRTGRSTAIGASKTI